MNELLMILPLAIWILGVFALGAVVGSLLNVCVVRLPLEKSILWPGSRCGHCLRPIRWYDNLPLLSYWLLRGRCRYCGAAFSIRYFLIELGTALGFAGLFYLEIVANWQGSSFLRQAHSLILMGDIPWQAWVMFLHHAALLSFLIVAAACDIEGRIIPLSVTVPGTLLGLVGATVGPWPWPTGVVEAMQGIPADVPWWQLPLNFALPTGLYFWPLWGPLPRELPPGSWLTGLATGLAGALVGSFLLRGVKVVFERGLGKEALGLGDADLMMMAGAFLGWQPVVIAFFAGAFAALFLAVPQLVLRGDNSLPFGPGLAVGVVLAWLGWPWVGPYTQFFFFDEVMLLVVVGVGGAFMFLLAFALGTVQRRRA